MVPLENGIEMDIYTVSSDSADKKTVKPKYKFWHIDREMLRFKIHFFMFIGGAGLGCVLAGIGFDTFGGHKTFLYTSIFAGSGMVLSIILHLCVRKQKGAIDVSLPAHA